MPVTSDMRKNRQFPNTKIISYWLPSKTNTKSNHFLNWKSIKNLFVNRHWPQKSVRYKQFCYHTFKKFIIFLLSIFTFYLILCSLYYIRPNYLNRKTTQTVVETFFQSLSLEKKTSALANYRANTVYAYCG